MTASQQADQKLIDNFLLTNDRLESSASMRSRFHADD